MLEPLLTTGAVWNMHTESGSLGVRISEVLFGAKGDQSRSPEQLLLLF